MRNNRAGDRASNNRESNNRGGEPGYEWTILDCEEEQWAQVVGVAPAPVETAGPAAPLATPGRGRLPVRAAAELPVARHLRQYVACGVLLLVLGGLLGLRLWQDAERGVALIKQDIANVVTLETVKAAATLPAAGRSQVLAVDFRGEVAMVQVVMTRTATNGTLVVLHQTRFYVHDAHGWRRTAPQSAFWGKETALDTPRLHIVYHELDSTLVAAVAPEADALQARLVQLLATPGVTEAQRITVEIMAQSGVWRTDDSNRIRIESPLLTHHDVTYTDCELLAWNLRQQLVGRALAQGQGQQPSQPQWMPMVQGLTLWLYRSRALPLTHRSMPHEATMPATVKPVLRLPWCTRCAGSSKAYYGQPSDLTFWSERAEDFIDYVVTRHGFATLSRLYVGLGSSEDWDDLAPAVFGMSAKELEADWQAAAAQAADEDRPDSSTCGRVRSRALVRRMTR